MHNLQYNIVCDAFLKGAQGPAGPSGKKGDRGPKVMLPHADLFAHSLSLLFIH